MCARDRALRLFAPQYPHLRSDTIRGLGLGAVLRALIGPRSGGADRGERRSGLRPHQFLASWR